MTSPDDILIHELEQARAQGDDARVLGLAAAICAQGGDQRRAAVWLEEAAERLIEASIGDDLDAAQAWAQAWARHTRSPRARQCAADLQERLAAVQAAEQALHGALVAGSIPVLRAALASLPAAGRRRGTAEIVARCEAMLADRSAEADALRRDLGQLVPEVLERAVGLAVRLATIDPAAAPERDELARRLARVDAIHRRAEAAFETGPIPPLAEAIAALRASLDRRGDSEALLILAEAELERRRAQLEELRTAFAGVVGSDVDAAAATLTSLAALDPGAPEAARLTEITTARVRLAELHATIESGLADPDAREVRAALRELERSPLRRPDTAELVATAHATTAHHRQRRRQITQRLAVVGAVAAAVMLVWGGLWQRDRAARVEINRTGDPERQLRLVRDYNAGFRLFATGRMRELEERLAEDCDRLAFAAALRQPTLQGRIEDLERYLRRPDARRVDQARAELQDLRLEAEDDAFARANRAADPQARIDALLAYAQRAGDAGRAARARALAANLAGGLDDAAWAAVEAGDPGTRAARAAAYLREKAHVRHREQAERLVAADRAEAGRRAAEEADDRAWAAARSSLAGTRAYLARDGGRHRAEAEAAEAAFLAAEEAAAWAAAAADGPPAERLARLRAYLAEGRRTHAAQAAAAIAACEREIDDAAWALASAPGTPEESDARLAAYLAGPTRRAHRTEAEDRRQALARAPDTAAWSAAMAPARPEARILALEAYLAGPTARGYSAASREEIARCFARLAAADAETLAGLPRAILARVAPAALARLPADVLASLPAVVQAQVPSTPAWASAAGVDATGRWAVLTLDEVPVRLRWILPGKVAAPGGDVVCEQGFWLAERECSQAEWSAVMAGFFGDGNPSARVESGLPVEHLTWRQVRDFVDACNDLLERRRLAARVRVPTVAEWTWLNATANGGAAAVDGGTRIAWDEARLRTLAWTSDASASGTRPCAAGAADGWGIVDLFGNVREWVGTLRDRTGAAAGGSYALPIAAATRAPQALAREARFPDLGLRLAIP